MAGTLIWRCEFGCSKGQLSLKLFLNRNVSENSGINSTPHGKIIKWKDQRHILSTAVYTKKVTASRKVSAAAAAKSLQSCPTLCSPIDGSPPGPPVPGILKARTLEWVAISFSNAWQWKVKVKSLSHVWLLATPWSVAYQAPLSMGFARREYWSRLPLCSPRKLSRR